MISIRRLASALCLVLCFSHYSNAQTPGEISVTGNLVNSTTTTTSTTTTWQNVGSWNQGLPCWAPEDAWLKGAYCGPQPYFNQGSFNFSYGITDVNQTVNIAAALPNSGTGLRVTGYNFGFLAKNGNGWDGAGLDYLSAYVRFADSSGKTVENYNYNLNYTFDWTQFNFSQNFTAPYSANKLSTATYGFIGGDTSNYWAGPYGPEIYNISFSLKYDVDPCATNPLYSADCPGFSNALSQITNTAVAEPAVTEPTTVATSAPATTSTAPATPAEPAVASAPPTAPTAPTATTATVTSPTRSVTPLSTTAVLSNIRRLEEQIQNTVSNTVQNSIQSSIEIGNNSAQQAQQEAARTQQESQQQSVLASQSSSSGPGNGTNNMTAASGTSPALGQGLVPGLPSLGISSSQITTAPESLGPSLSMVSIGTASTGTGAFANPNRSWEILPGEQDLNETPLAVLTRPGDPTQAARTGNRESTTTDTTTVAEPAVRNTAPPSQLAGGADITAMSRAVDITSYTTQRLADAAFYQPREIYRNQRVVDNARVLRGLGTDRLHQQMVEQQYKTGN